MYRMSVDLNPREVLAYLNELGYVNITAQQLKKFIKGKILFMLLSIYALTKLCFCFLDLKKLIKYDQRQAHYFDNTIDYSSVVGNRSEIFSALHATGTIASNAKLVPRKENVITVEVRRPPKEISKFTLHHLTCNENVKSENIQQCTCQEECCKSGHTIDSSGDTVSKRKSSEKLSDKPTSSKANVKPKGSCALF